MASNFFINYSLSGMSFAYRTIGMRLTNLAIEKTAGSIFTGGVSVEDLCRDMDLLATRNIGSISMMVVEGLTNAEEKTLDYFYKMSMDTVKKMSEGRDEAHFAMKLTAFVSLEVMEKISSAQKTFVHEILALDYARRDNILTREQLAQNLAQHGITDYSPSDFDQLVSDLSHNGEMTPVARYIGGHLIKLNRELSPLETQIAIKLGGLEASDF